MDVRRFLPELLDLASRRIRDHGDVAGRVQIDANPALDLVQRRLIDGHGDERELVIHLDLVNLLERR